MLDRGKLHHPRAPQRLGGDEFDQLWRRHEAEKRGANLPDILPVGDADDAADGDDLLHSTNPLEQHGGWNDGKAAKGRR
jgi:hypothetical protein